MPERESWPRAVPADRRLAVFSAWQGDGTREPSMFWQIGDEDMTHQPLSRVHTLLT